ncbi:MAG: hypothetical protein KA715_06170 [Xanthomonadaceae bacterium]|nr:hypothetical protein [Xanthomonadaceae bacterium]
MDKSRRALILASLLTISSSVFPTAIARQADPPSREPASCGIVTKIEGAVLISSADRTQIIQAKNRSSVPCGAWITIKEGWAEIRLGAGMDMRFSSETFAQILDPAFEKDHIALIRGQVLVKAKPGTGAFTVVTANARVRFKDTFGVVVYMNEEEDTQVLGLGINPVSFENRFSEKSALKIARGEISTMSLKQLRTIPTVAENAHQETLVAVGEDMQLEQSEVQKLVAEVQPKGQRHLASVTTREPEKRGWIPHASNDDEDAPKKKPSRSPQSYNPVLKKLLGDETVDMGFLYPKTKVERKPQAIEKKNKEESEKQKLMGELSKLKHKLDE